MSIFKNIKWSNSYIQFWSFSSVNCSVQFHSYLVLYFLQNVTSGLQVPISACTMGHMAILALNAALLLASLMGSTTHKPFPYIHSIAQRAWGWTSHR